jgi:exonuclease III
MRYIRAMKIATYNVNGIRARLPLLLRWLGEQSPDIVCLQELKAPQEQRHDAFNPRAWIATCAAGNTPVITRQLGSRSNESKPESGF